MNPAILALDLGTTMGWACRPTDGTVAHGWVSLKGGRFEGGGMRFLRFSRWLTELAWGEQSRVPYQGVPVGTIKRHATGRGNADKAAVIEAIQAKGHPVTNDNEADALALLYWAIEEEL